MLHYGCTILYPYQTKTWYPLQKHVKTFHLDYLTQNKIPIYGKKTYSIELFAREELYINRTISIHYDNYAS